MITSDQLLNDLFAVDRAAKATVYHGHRLAESLNAAHGALWSLPDARLAAVLNNLGAAKLQDLMQSHGTIAAAVNAALDHASAPAPRAIIGAGRDIQIANDGTITVTPRPEPIEPSAP